MITVIGVGQNERRTPTEIETMKKDAFTHCKKCGQHIDKLVEGGRYLKRTSPIGVGFEGECAPACEYHHINATNETSLVNALTEATQS